MSDFIKREDAIVIINKWFDFIKLNPDILIDSIKSIPTAEPLVTVKAKQNKGLYLDTDEETLLETEYIVVATDGMYKEYIHETDGKPKVGKWEECKVVDIEDTTITEVQSAFCPICHKYHTTPYMYYFDYFNYCPNCGAKMERSE